MCCSLFTLVIYGFSILPCSVFFSLYIGVPCRGITSSDFPYIDSVLLPSHVKFEFPHWETVEHLQLCSPFSHTIFLTHLFTFSHKIPYSFTSQLDPTFPNKLSFIARGNSDSPDPVINDNTAVSCHWVNTLFTYRSDSVYIKGGNA